MCFYSLQLLHIVKSNIKQQRYMVRINYTVISVYLIYLPIYLFIFQLENLVFHVR